MLLLSVYCDQYLEDAKADKQRDSFRKSTPIAPSDQYLGNMISFISRKDILRLTPRTEPYTLFDDGISSTPKSILLKYEDLNFICKRRNSIHAFNRSEFGDSEEFFRYVDIYLEFLKRIQKQLPTR